jgi:hypothetical protein
VIALIVGLVALFALMVFMWVSVGREPGPGPADVALAYERAWDELDFGLLFDLSGAEMRDGMRRDRFIAAKRAAYAAAGAGARARLRTDVEVDTSVAGNQTALVVTRVGLEGDSVRNNVLLEKRTNGWVVVGYSLRPDTELEPPSE